MPADQKAVLLVGFGGPRNMNEVRPFLESVLKGVPIPKERFEEVLSHYEHFDGHSPYNEITESQRHALEISLHENGHFLPVRVGLRHSSPSLAEAFQEFKLIGVREVIAIVLASFRSYASFEKYQDRVREAQVLAGAEDIFVNYTESFASNPLYFEAQADPVRNLMDARIPEDERNKTFVIFSAHSIPMAMAKASGYDEQFETASRAVAKILGLRAWKVAYQSRSGNPREPWLEPDVKAVIREIDRSAFTHVLFVPIGFLCDNVEVLFDLDVDAREAVEARGFQYLRATTVMDHPIFIRMMSQLVSGQ